jgi:dethiobiotin synthetase
MKRVIVITGTDTGVGKSVFTAGCAMVLRDRGINVGVMKPVATGGVMKEGRLVSPDALFLMNAIECEDEYSLVNPIIYEEPLAPAVAAERAGSVINTGAILKAFRELRSRYDLLLVEGVGGIMVPLRYDYSFCELIREMQGEVVVVGRPGLGTINHTLLTMNEARGRSLSIIGFAINGFNDATAGPAERTAAAAIKKISHVPCCGVLPFDPGIDVEECRYGNLKELVRSTITWEKFI